MIDPFFKIKHRTNARTTKRKDPSPKSYELFGAGADDRPVHYRFRLHSNGRGFTIIRARNVYRGPWGPLVKGEVHATKGDDVD